MERLPLFGCLAFLATLIAGAAGGSLSAQVVRGRVADGEGKAVPGVVLRFQKDGLNGQRVDCYGDEDGSFETHKPLSPGIWDILTIVGPPVVKPKGVRIKRGEAPGALDIRLGQLHRTGTIEGFVRDSKGKPVSDVTVRVRGGSGAGITNDAGRFIVERSRARAPNRVVLEIEPFWHFRSVKAKNKVFYPYQRLVTFATWGQRGLELKLRPGIQATLQVVDGDTTKPINDYWYRFTDRPRFGPHLSYHVKAKDGLARMMGLSPGRDLVFVYATDPKYVMGSPHPIDVAEKEGQRFQVKLYRPRKLRVKVVAPDGEPIAASRVELWEENGSYPSTLTSHARRFTDYTGSVKHSPFRLDGLTTGNDGIVELQCRPTKTSLTLALLGPKHVRKLVRDVRLPEEGAKPLVVKVALGGVVHGICADTLGTVRDASNFLLRLNPIAPPPGANRIRGRAGGAGAVKHHRWVPNWNYTDYHRVEDERFRIAHVPPGRWAIVHYGDTPNWGFAIKPLAIVDIKEGGVHELKLNTDGLAPVRFTGRLTLNGKPGEDVKVTATGWVPGGAQTGLQRSRVTHADDAGRFSIENMVALTWSFFAHLPDEFGSSSYMHGQMFRIADGLKLVHGKKLFKTFEIRTKPLAVRILSPNGKARVPYRYVEFEQDAAPRPNRPAVVLAQRIANKDGIVRLQHAPFGPVRVYVRPTDWALWRGTGRSIRDRRLLLGVVDTRALKKDQVAELRIPLGK